MTVFILNIFFLFRQRPKTHTQKTHTQKKKHKKKTKKQKQTNKFETRMIASVLKQDPNR